MFPGCLYIGCFNILVPMEYFNYWIIGKTPSIKENTARL